MKLIPYGILAIMAAMAILSFGLHFDVNEAGEVIPYLREYLLVGGLVFLLACIGAFFKPIDSEPSRSKPATSSKDEGKEEDFEKSERKMSGSLAIALSLITVAAFLVTVKLGWQMIHQEVWPSSGTATVIKMSNWQAPVWVYANLFSNFVLFLVGLRTLSVAKKGETLLLVAIGWLVLKLIKGGLSWLSATLILIPVFLVSLLIWGIARIFRNPPAKT